MVAATSEVAMVAVKVAMAMALPTKVAMVTVAQDGRAGGGDGAIVNDGGGASKRG